jgi:hypothetical protein
MICGPGRVQLEVRTCEERAGVDGLTHVRCESKAASGFRSASWAHAIRGHLAHFIEACHWYCVGIGQQREQTIQTSSCVDTNGRYVAASSKGQGRGGVLTLVATRGLAEEVAVVTRTTSTPTNSAGLTSCERLDVGMRLHHEHVCAP